jgi:hypothetical protein
MIAPSHLCWGGWQIQFNYLLGNQYKEPLFAQKNAFWPKIIALLSRGGCFRQATPRSSVRDEGYCLIINHQLKEKSV